MQSSPYLNLLTDVGDDDDDDDVGVLGFKMKNKYREKRPEISNKIHRERRDS